MKTRTKTLALLGLACLFILALPILWRSFRSSSPSKSNQGQPVSQLGISGDTAQAPPPERVVQFPEDRSLGTVYVIPWGSRTQGLSARGLREIGKAQGSVFVPAEHELVLHIPTHESPDLSALAALKPDDIQQLRLTLPDTISHNSWWPPSMLTNDDLIHLKGLSSLQSLHLTGYKVTDEGLKHLSSLTSLRTLILEVNLIEDEGLKHLKGMDRLERLDLIRTRVTDEGIGHLAQLPSLRTLNLHWTQVSDQVFVPLKRLTELRSLNITSVTGVTDSGLAHLKDMPYLTDVYFGGHRNQITDSGVKHFTHLSSPRIISVRSDLITDAGVKEFEGMHTLERLVIESLSVTRSALVNLQSSLPKCDVWIPPVRTKPTPAPTPMSPLS